MLFDIYYVKKNDERFDLKKMTSVYNLLICCLILLVATFSHVNSSELSMKAELEVLANKLLGEEQPLQNAEEESSRYVAWK